MTPLLFIAALLVIYGGRLRAAAAGRASVGLPPVPATESRTGRLIVDAPQFRTTFPCDVVVDGQAFRLAYSPYAVDLPAGQHQVALAARGLMGRKSAPLAVNVVAGQATVVVAKASWLSGRVTLSVVA